MTATSSEYLDYGFEPDATREGGSKLLPWLSLVRGAIGREDELTSPILHRELLRDDVRNAAFSRAIHQVVRLGDVVVDLGAGTGILGLFACQAGARRVLAIERGPFCSLAQRLFADNGYGDRLVWIPKDSTDVELTHRADVLISETLGAAGVEEGLLTYLPDARDRFLKPGGKMVPRRLSLFAAPVSTPSPLLKPESPVCLEIQSFSSLATAVRNSSWNVRIQPEELLGPPTLLQEFDLCNVEIGTELCLHTHLTLTRNGELHGAACWFEAELDVDVRLSNSPEAHPTHWAQLLLPSANTKLAEGSSKEVQFALRSLTLDAGTLWRWSFRGCGARQEFQENLPQQSRAEYPGPRLRLSRKGKVERELLELIMQSKTFEDLVEHLRMTWPEHYAPVQLARQRVLELLKRVCF